MPQTEAQKRAAVKYKKKMVKQFGLKLNRRTDADIIERLEQEENTQGFIKQAIRKAMEASE